MKTSEFIEIMENYGYIVTRKHGSIYIGENQHSILEVLEYRHYVLDTKWLFFDELSDVEKEKIMKVVFEYISTPLCDRGDEVKYYLKLDYKDTPVNEECLYLNYDESEKEYFFDDKAEDERFRTMFTQDEIDKLDTTNLIKEEVK